MAPTFTDPPTEPTIVSVASIAYATEGGKNGDKHLLITVAVVDDLNNPVAGASVTIWTDRYVGNKVAKSWTAQDSTGTDGIVTFRISNTPIWVESFFGDLGRICGAGHMGQKAEIGVIAVMYHPTLLQKGAYRSFVVGQSQQLLALKSETAILN